MSPFEKNTNLTPRLGRWSARHRKTAIFGWLAFVVAAVAVGATLGTQRLDPDTVGAGESQRAQEIIEAGAFADSADESVFVASESLTAAEQEFRAVLADVVRAVSAQEGVSNVRSPLDAGGATLVSKDRHAALVQFELSDADEQASTLVEPVLDAVAGVQERHPAFRVEQFGAASGQKAFEETIGADFTRAEYTALPVTLGVLVVVFGALVAAGIPMLVGLTAVAAAIGLLSVPSQLFAIHEGANVVVLLIGLAVGVDYSLFYLKREREERAAGKGSEAALEAAAATSGRAILISGLTVIAALAGMFLGGSAIWTSIAVGAILVVAIAVAGSLTVLPATLGLLGDRVERGRIPLVSRRRRNESRVWSGILDRVLRRPALSAALAGGLLVLLAAPALAMRTAESSIDDLPRSLPIMQTYDRIQERFPGGPLPAVVAIDAGDATAPAVQDGIARLREKAVATGLMAEPITVQSSPNGRVALVSIPLAGSGTDDMSLGALRALREEVIPATVGSLPGVEAAVTGQTAISEDFRALMAERMPLVIGFVLLLAFALLLAAFRSVVIAAKAVLLNLLSVGAAYGLIVAVFQWGWGESLLGFESTAAFVMVAVFAIFLTVSTVDMKQFGFGLAVAILIDATIVRAVLLPATMKLLGDWNWYLPSWLQWLPRLEHERPAEPPLEPQPEILAA